MDRCADERNYLRENVSNASQAYKVLFLGPPVNEQNAKQLNNELKLMNSNELNVNIPLI